MFARVLLCSALLGGTGPVAIGATVLGPPRWTASWLWGAEPVHGSLGLFRHTIEVRPGLRQAVVQLSGDDGFTFFVNGRECTKGGFWWKTTPTVDITDALRPGTNMLAAEVHNAAHPGGFLLQGALLYSDGTRETIITDRSWRFSSQAADGWLDPGFDGSGWEQCTELGSPPVAPWGEMPVDHVATGVNAARITIEAPDSAQAGDQVVVRVEAALDSRTPFDHEAYVRLRRGDVVFLETAGATRPPTSQLSPGGSAQAGPFDLSLSRFLSGGDYEIEAGLYGAATADKPARRSIRISAHPSAGRLTRTQVRDHGGAPMLFIDGRPVYSMWFYSNAPQPTDTVAFHGAGVDIHTFGMPLGWTGPDVSDFTEVDRLMLSLLEQNPGAYAVPRVYLAAPGFWCDAHEDELTRYADGVGWESNGWGGTRHESYASKLWRQDAGEALRRLIRHIAESAYSDRVLGLHLANGIYGEWHYWSATDFPDTSEPMRRAFAERLRAKYGTNAALRTAFRDEAVRFDTVTCPTLAERQHGDVGMFRDPTRGRKVMDYYEAFFGEEIDAIERFCRIVKEETDDRWLTLAFCGYQPDLGWPQEGDHRGFAQALDSPYIDAFSSPHSYNRRALGQDGYFRHFPGSVRLHGKLFIDEGDDRTYLARDPAFTHVKTVDGSIQVVRREFGNAIANDVGLWYMDQQGDWFHDDAIMAEIGRLKHAADEAVDDDKQRPAEVAVFYSMRTEWYLAGRTSGINQASLPMIVENLGQLCRAGAPFDLYVMSDITHPDLPDYKAYVFLDAHYLTGPERAAIEGLRRDDKLLVWYYAPGLISDSGLSAQRMGELIGMNVRQLDAAPCAVTLSSSGATYGPGAEQSPMFCVDDPDAESLGTIAGSDLVGLAVRHQRDYSSLYSAAPGLPWDVLMGAFRDAGVHVYSATGDPLQVGAGFTCLHTATPGEKVIHLPHPADVTDVATGRLLGRGLSEIRAAADAGQTFLWRLTR